MQQLNIGDIISINEGDDYRPYNVNYKVTKPFNFSVEEKGWYTLILDGKQHRTYAYKMASQLLEQGYIEHFDITYAAKF